MSAKNKARKSTGPRASLNLAPPQSNSTNRTLRTRGSAQVNNSTAQGDSSDSDVPTQRLNKRNQNSTIQSTPGSSGLSSRASTSRAADSDDDEQSTLRLSNGRNQGSRRKIQAVESSSDTTSDSDEAPGRIKLTQEKGGPKKKKKRVIRRTNSDSEEYDQTVSSTVSPNKTTLQPGNMSRLVNKCVYYLLIADQKKCPIKRADILKHVFDAGDKKCYAEVLKEAGAVLKKTYGMEIIISEKQRGEYMLINILSHDLGIQEFIEYSPSELQKRGFIFYLLTIIYMNENLVTDDELTSALKPLGIDLNARTPNPMFGDVRKYLMELVKQNYLDRKQISKEPPKSEFSWGERAYQEVDKKDLLEFACQIMGDDLKPEQWILQYNDAMSRRQESA